MPIFISYRRSDPLSRRLISDLQSVYGSERLFFDATSIAAGAAFPASIADAIRASVVVIALIGPGWLGSSATPRRADEEDWVVTELDLAQKYGKPVLPVLLGTAMPSPQSLPPQVQYVAYREALPRVATTLEELVNEVIADLARLGVSPRPRNELTGSSRLASVTSWTRPVRPDVALQQILDAASAIGGKIAHRGADHAVVRFGEAGSKWRSGVLLVREDKLPVVLQVRVRTGPGVTLVEARCDEAWGQGLFPQRKFEGAFARIWAAVAPH